MKKTDIVIIVVVILFSLGGILFSKVVKVNSDSKEIVVRISGQQVYKFSEPGEWKIEDKSGKYITTLHYDGQFIWVTDSNCPDNICERTGKVGPGGSIICVPNRTIIQFQQKQKKETNKQVDVETW